MKRKGLGRRHALDDRDQAFQVERVRLPPVPTPANPWRWWSHPLKLDQGYTGTCVAHGGTHMVENSPICPMGSINPFDLYREVVLLDEWLANDSEATGPVSGMQFGSSVRALGKALVNRKLISQYLWAYDVETLADWVWRRGQVVIGVNWYGGMFDTDSNHFVHVGGYVEGGHCVTVDGVAKDREFFRFLNSWGPDFGNAGMGRISFDDMQRLLNEDGEAMMALEVS